MVRLYRDNPDRIYKNFKDFQAKSAKVNRIRDKIALSTESERIQTDALGEPDTRQYLTNPDRKCRESGIHRRIR